MVKARRPGDALDVAMGQGRNALYLASLGWRVTGFDISDEALRQAREAAAARKLDIEAVHADMESWDYGSEKWDLVALVYAGESCEARKLQAVRRSLRRGGLVVVEGFHKDAAPGIGCGTGELAAIFRADFAILRDDVVDDVSDWGNRRGVPERIVRFAAEKRWRRGCADAVHGSHRDQVAQDLPHAPHARADGPRMEEPRRAV